MRLIVTSLLDLWLTLLIKIGVPDCSKVILCDRIFHVYCTRNQRSFSSVELNPGYANGMIESDFSDLTFDYLWIRNGSLLLEPVKIVCPHCSSESARNSRMPSPLRQVRFVITSFHRGLSAFLHPEPLIFIWPCVIRATINRFCQA